MFGRVGVKRKGGKGGGGGVCQLAWGGGGGPYGGCPLTDELG